MPSWTDHARQRAAERFPGEGMDMLYASAKRIGKKTRRRIKQSCPQAARKYMAGEFVGRYCLVTRCGAVFVVEAPDTIVTVFRLINS